MVILTVNSWLYYRIWSIIRLYAVEFNEWTIFRNFTVKEKYGSQNLTAIPNITELEMFSIDLRLYILMYLKKFVTDQFIKMNSISFV